MRTLSLKTMADWCRGLGSPLRAGLSLKEALKLASRNGTGEIRALNEKLSERIDAGDELAEALETLPVKVPPLFYAMALVGTKTGRFPEVLRELESYFRFQLQLKREFLQQIFWPIMQLILAIFIVAGMLLLIGALSTPAPGHKPFDPLGFGVGVPGATKWLVLCFGSLAFLAVMYRLARTVLGWGDRVDYFLLRVPVLGPCLLSLTMSRLCLAMRMTMDSSLSISKTIPLSLDATDNQALIKLSPTIVHAVRKEGMDLADAFAAHPVFPEEFLHVLRTAETAGSIPEEMGRLSEHYNEQSRLQMALLNQAAGWAVWGMVAALLVFLIFRMALAYIGMLNEAVKNPMGV
jgi:type IV pilus assembly protein PilC